MGELRHNETSPVSPPAPGTFVCWGFFFAGADVLAYVLWFCRHLWGRNMLSTKHFWLRFDGAAPCRA